MDSIIPKIRRWRIEILPCEEFDIMGHAFVAENDGAAADASLKEATKKPSFLTGRRLD